MKISYIRPNKPTPYERAIQEAYNTHNKKLVKLCTMTSVLLLNCNYILASANDDPIKTLGYDAINLIQFVLTIIAIVMALFEVGKAMLEGDPKRIPSIFAKYGIGVICVYAIPGVYFKIKGAFDGWGY